MGVQEGYDSVMIPADIGTLSPCLVHFPADVKQRL